MKHPTFPNKNECSSLPRWSLRDLFVLISQVFLIYHVVLWIQTGLPVWLLSVLRSTEQQEIPISHSCRPFLPQFPDALPQTPLFEKASYSLDNFLRIRTAEEDIDSLSIAIVTPSGPIFQKGYGVLKANETDPLKYGTVDENSIYRIASISKMFTVAGTLIQRDRGALNWDDPITKFLPNFKYNPNSWADSADIGFGDHGSIDPITIRQLASHMAGIVRENDPDEIKWPKGPLPGPGTYEPRTKEQLFGVIAKRPLVVPPYSYPVYSNAGISLLGLTNVAANGVYEQDSNITTWADLAQRDIFLPVGMNSSSFEVTSDTVHRIAIASQDSWDTDVNMGEATNAAGGQFSSLADLSAFMQTILDPHRHNSVLSPYSVREWLRPLYGWGDDLTEVGAPWEIVKYKDSTGRPMRFYQKSGNLFSYHSVFSINPASSYGVIVLMTGRYFNSAQIAHEAITRFQPLFDKFQELSTKTSFGGRWSYGEDNEAVIKVAHGSLWLQRLTLEGVDILALLAQSQKNGKTVSVPLWSTTRMGEFRFSFGKEDGTGCLPFWMALDRAYANGAAINMLYFKKEGKNNEYVLHIPSVLKTLKRISTN